MTASFPNRLIRIPPFIAPFHLVLYFWSCHAFMWFYYIIVVLVACVVRPFLSISLHHRSTSTSTATFCLSPLRVLFISSFPTLLAIRQLCQKATASWKERASCVRVGVCGHVKEILCGGSGRSSYTRLEVRLICTVCELCTFATPVLSICGTSRHGSVRTFFVRLMSVVYV